MNNKIIPPSMVAAMIAGGGIGTAAGFMTAGERLEEQGASIPKQLTGGIGNGIKDGVIGAGIGAGVSGTAIALKQIFRK